MPVKKPVGDAVEGEQGEEKLTSVRSLSSCQVCHSKSGEVNSSKVANLVKAYVDKYKHARKK